MTTTIITNAYGLDGMEATVEMDDQGDMELSEFPTEQDAYAYSRAHQRCVSEDGDCVFCGRWDH